MTIKYVRNLFSKEKYISEFIKSYISAHQSSLWGHSLVYDCTPNYTLGIFSRGYIFDFYTGTLNITIGPDLKIIRESHSQQQYDVVM